MKTLALNCEEISGINALIGDVRENFHDTENQGFLDDSAL
jgi:hypothetical protein